MQSNGVESLFKKQNKKTLADAPNKLMAKDLFSMKTENKKDLKLGKIALNPVDAQRYSGINFCLDHGRRSYSLWRQTL